MTAKKRTSRPRAAATTETEGPITTKNEPHPTDPSIWSDGRPRPSAKGNPYRPGTAASEAWEAGIGRAPSGAGASSAPGVATTGRRTRVKNSAAASASSAASPKSAAKSAAKTSTKTEA